MTKHAICIMAHKDAPQINKLIELLDHPQIDIYLHLDKKSKIVQEKDIETPRHSGFKLVERHDVRWGDISLVETELELFKAVTESNCDYTRVHLISAQDMPVKSADYILKYFEQPENAQKEFMESSEYPGGKVRLKYYWFYTKHMRVGVVYKVIRHSLLWVQKMLHIDRLKHLPLKYKMGSEWVSLTFTAIKYIVGEYPKYQYVFKHGTCVDELYKQMLVGGGEFNLSTKGNLRYAKFQGSSPKLISEEQVPELVSNPDILFARKFDWGQQNAITALLALLKDKK